MKYILSIAVSILAFTNLFAQMPINLPVYQQGKYELDTIYSYYGPLFSTGNGSITISGTLVSNFVSGVKFKVVVDSTNQGTSPVHATVRDSLGTWVGMYKGDTLDMPLNLKVYSGAVGLHIIVEGIPLIAGQSYRCDLNYSILTGLDWGVWINEHSQNSCVVGQAQGISNNNHVRGFSVFPNPANDVITVKADINSLGSTYMIADQYGRKILTGKLTDEITSVSISHLPKGVYYFQSGEFNAPTFKIIK